MRKLLIATFAAIFSFLGSVKAFALDPDECGPANGRYLDLAFVSANMKQEYAPKLKTDFGFSLIKGNTYYLHKPIAGLLRFGIDATWTDLTYANYKVNEIYTLYDEIESYTIHEVDVALGVGVSATVNLFKRFQASAYFRYNPTFQMMLNNSEFQGGFANMFTTGVNATYARVGLGIEARFGKAKTKTYLNIDDMDGILDGEINFGHGRRLSTTLSGIRAYICFRF